MNPGQYSAQMQAMAGTQPQHDLSLQRELQDLHNYEIALLILVHQRTAQVAMSPAQELEYLSKFPLSPEDIDQIIQHVRHFQLTPMPPHSQQMPDQQRVERSVTGEGISDDDDVDDGIQAPGTGKKARSPKKARPPKKSPPKSKPKPKPSPSIPPKNLFLDEALLEVRITELQTNLYRGILTRRTEDVCQILKEKVRLGNTMGPALTKVCNHGLLLKQVPFDPETDTLQTLLDGSGKLQKLLIFLGRCKSEGKRVCLFASSAAFLDLMIDFLDLAAMPFSVLSSAVPSNERNGVVDDFNRPGQGFGVLLASYLVTGSLGKVIRVNTVCLIDVAKTVVEERRALSLIKGLTDETHVPMMRYFTKNTYEEGLLESLLGKMPPTAPPQADMEPSSFTQAVMEAVMEANHKYGLTGIFHDGDNETPDIDINDPDFWSKLIPVDGKLSLTTFH